jgi:hypothetical protein
MTTALKSKRLFAETETAGLEWQSRGKERAKMAAGEGCIG